MNRVISLFLKKTKLNKLLFSKKLNKLIINTKDYETVEKFICKDLLSSIEKKIDKEGLVENSIDEIYDLQIIIPCYNSEKFLKQCMHSIGKIKHPNLITFVDDGSTDNTSKILKDYASKNANIEIIRKENGGLSSARNFALKHIKAKYILFLDSDDMLENFHGEIDEILDIALRSGADFVNSPYYRVSENGIKLLKIKQPNGFIDDIYTSINGYPWGKIIKSDLFKNLIFPYGMIFEDTIISQILFELVKKPYGYNNPIYYYRINSKGICGTISTNPRNSDTFFVNYWIYFYRQLLGLPNNQNYYEQLVKQLYLNIIRTKSLEPDKRMGLFYTYCYFMNNYFYSYKSKIKDNFILETAIKNYNFELCDYFCKHF